MCCLFGIIDYGKNLSVSQKEHILTVLSKECELRGVDATGIAYNGQEKLHIYKRPLPAHKMRFRVLPDTNIIMGHTRMTTQGSEQKNRNNHPFGGTTFALAHNGIIDNDRELRKSENLPPTDIETDSYIAVQLLERSDSLNFDSLRDMAELLKGTFTITVLDEKENLYFIRGSNPMCLYHWENLRLYLYASTEEILNSAIRNLRMNLGKPKEVPFKSGDILRIDKSGELTYSSFTMKPMYTRPYSFALWDYYPPYTQTGESCMDDLYSISGMFGYTREDIDALLAEGITPEEIEEYFYGMVPYEL